LLLLKCAMALMGEWPPHTCSIYESDFCLKVPSYFCILAVLQSITNRFPLLKPAVRMYSFYIILTFVLFTCLEKARVVNRVVPCLLDFDADSPPLTCADGAFILYRHLAFPLTSHSYECLIIYI